MTRRLPTAACLLIIVIAGCTPQAHRDPTPTPAAPAATLAAESESLLPVHPFLLVSATDLPALRTKAQADPMLQAWLTDIRDTVHPRSDDRRAPWERRLEDAAFLAMLDDDRAQTELAVDQLRQVLRKTDPEAYLKQKKDSWYGDPLRAFALAWDFLQPRMTAAEKAELLPLLERWCDAAYQHTEQQWWRDASYNVGADPVSGNGLLALSLLHDSADPLVATCYREYVRRIGENYFPTVWKPSGICYEGPGYAKRGLNEAILLANAVQRGGAGDLTAGSGAQRAMQYLMYQYMPTGGCAPIGDNTSFGGYTFSAEYLLGLGKTRDAAGLWTWRKYAKQRWLDTLIAYIWYPADLAPISPRDSGLPTSRYFEVTPNRAGYVFARSAWDDPHAAFFAFTTRFEQCNHQHYDMDSILFGGRGTLFATHQMLFPYASDRHGVDYEHNMIVIDGGGWPAANRLPRSCGTDNSTEGLLVGLALSKFADYVRGDAKGAYHDNSLPTGEPAVRAERTCLFVKQGPTPYLLILDDNQQSGAPVEYDWLWHAPTLPTHGTAAMADPLVMTAKDGCCALQFIAPAQPVLTTQPALAEIELKPATRPSRRATSGPTSSATTGPTTVSLTDPTTAPAYSTTSPTFSSDELLMPDPPSPTTGPASRPAYEIKPSGLTRLRVAQTGVRVHFAALASIQQDEAARPHATTLPVSCPSAASAVRLDLPDGTSDTLAWQSEEDRLQLGYPLTAGDLQTDGLLAMVRTTNGKVTAFVLGEGTYLRWRGQWLVKSSSSVSVSSGAGDSQTTGRLRTRQALPPEVPGDVSVWSLH